MKRTTNKKTSIYFDLLKLMIIGIVVSGALFSLINYVSVWAIDSYYSIDYQNSRNDEYVKKFQEEINEEKLSTKDIKKIEKWVKQQRVLSVEIYKGNDVIYNSIFFDQSKQLHNKRKISFYDFENHYKIKFTDGVASLNIYGMYAYQMYIYVLIINLLFSFAVFFIIVMLGIKKTIGYIRKIDDEISILEGGNLGYPITVMGTNELASLANGLNDMRCSFKEHLENESQLVKQNRKMITEMSHDLRTPLTSIIIYSDLLLQGKYESKEQMIEYIKKINKKTHNIKQLTDHLFEYSLVVADKNIELDVCEKAEIMFFDMLSEMCTYLEQHGIKTTADLNWSDSTVKVNHEYLFRIFDNVTSNILKYADKSRAVCVTSDCISQYVKISFENSYSEMDTKEDSTNIGVENIKSMMKQMSGYCEIEANDESYKITLYFKSE